MSAAKTIWSWAGVADSVRGRLTILGWAVIGLTAIPLALWVFLRDRYGTLGVSVLVFAAVLLFVGFVGLITAYIDHRRKPDVDAFREAVVAQLQQPSGGATEHHYHYAQLHKELGELIHEGVELRASLREHDQSKLTSGAFDVNLFHAKRYTEPLVEDWHKRSWTWVEENSPDNLGFLSTRTVPNEPALLTHPGFVDARVNALRSVLEQL